MTPNFKLLWLCIALLPVCAAAQTNIKKAFDAFVDNPATYIIQSHALEKDPDTGSKVSQFDIYRFSLHHSQLALVKEVEKSFRLDADNAYRMVSGVRTFNEAPIAIAIGEGNDSGVMIAEFPGTNYIYSCFLDLEDQLRNHRYAYAMDWVAIDDSIVGTLAITYATTLKYRQHSSLALPGILQNFMLCQDADTLQQLASNDFMKLVSFDSHSAPFAMNNKNWFSEFMTYVASLDSDDPSTRIAIASCIYDHIKNISQYDVDDSDKQTAAQILLSVILDSDDDIVNSILNNSLNHLK